MKLDELTNVIEMLLPPDTSVKGDRIGLQIESEKTDLRSILTTLEITDDVIDEAKKLGTDCIITFHPLIYSPLTALTNNDRVGKLTKRIIKENLTVISVHTCFDAFINGTSYLLAEKIGLSNLEFLSENPAFPGSGMGVTGYFEKSIESTDLLERVMEVCNSPLKYNELSTVKKIKKVSIVGGSGMTFLENALSSCSDAFITADISYHNFHAVMGKIMLIDPGHYEMEQFVPEALSRLLTDNLIGKGFDLIKSSLVNTNPVRYFPDTQKYITMQRKDLIINNKEKK